MAKGEIFAGVILFFIYVFAISNVTNILDDATISEAISCIVLVTLSGLYLIKKGIELFNEKE
jgi:hypothetical protein